VSRQRGLLWSKLRPVLWRRSFRNTTVVLLLLSAATAPAALGQGGAGGGTGGHLQGRDYRIYQSPVKHQQGRGTCTAFAVVGALETFPGVPTDLSEQYLYAAVKSVVYHATDQVYSGEVLHNYVTALTETGVCHERDMPYEPQAEIWRQSEDSFEQLKKEVHGTRLLDLLQDRYNKYKLAPAQYSYYSGPEAKEIKRVQGLFDAGCKAIPATYQLFLPQWVENSGKSVDAFVPDELLWAEVDGARMLLKDARVVEPRLVDKILEDRIAAGYVVDVDTLWGGHALLLVGYDEHGFIFKNSWGTDWGDQGYAYMSYDFHRLFGQEILAIQQLKYWPCMYREIQVEEPDLHLKSLPRRSGRTKALGLSVFNLNPLSRSDFEVLSYALRPTGDAGAVIEVEPTIDLFSVDRGHAAQYPLLFLGANLSYEVTVSYRFNGKLHKRRFGDVTWANREYVGRDVSP
jgi:hypothetical protein